MSLEPASASPSEDGVSHRQGPDPAASVWSRARPRVRVSSSAQRPMDRGRARPSDPPARGGRQGSASAPGSPPKRRAHRAQYRPLEALIDALEEQLLGQHLRAVLRGYAAELPTTLICTAALTLALAAYAAPGVRGPRRADLLRLASDALSDVGIQPVTLMQLRALGRTGRIRLFTGAALRARRVDDAADGRPEGEG